jgi:2-(1,2-epoxy-1,2-dihydrophenyl)acetyl-CoA isomerase
VDDIVTERAEHVGIVRINRPDRGNSVTPTVVTELGDAVEALCAEEAVGAVVLTGTGSVFCAGADVREMYDVYQGDGADGLMAYLADVWMPAVQRTVRRLWAAPKPTVASFNGSATAGGLDFGLTCDVRIAASTARFAESYVNLGMVPVAGGAYLLPSLVGRATAMRLLASGRLVGAEEAERIGLVEEVCAPQELAHRAIALADELAQGPAATFAGMKRVARLAATPELDRALDESLAANIELIAQGDVRERIVAVMERYSA